MNSEPSVSSEVRPAVEASSAPRAIAGRLTAGFIALVLGGVALVAAVHESLYFAALGPGGALVTCDATGLCTAASSSAIAYASTALALIATATWLLGSVLLDIGRRLDTATGAQPRAFQWGVEAPDEPRAQ